MSNSYAHLKREEERLSRMAAAVAALRAQCEFYAAQIAEARHRGLDGFDSQRFMKPTKP